MWGDSVIVYCKVRLTFQSSKTNTDSCTNWISWSFLLKGIGESLIWGCNLRSPDERTTQQARSSQKDRQQQDENIIGTLTRRLWCRLEFLELLLCSTTVNFHFHMKCVTKIVIMWWSFCPPMRHVDVSWPLQSCFDRPGLTLDTQHEFQYGPIPFVPTRAPTACHSSVTEERTNAANLNNYNVDIVYKPRAIQSKPQRSSTYQ